MTTAGIDQTPMIPAAENHARVKENLVFYYLHLGVGFLSAFIGSLLPYHFSWLEKPVNLLVFAFGAGNFSVLITRLQQKNYRGNNKSGRIQAMSLAFSFGFTLLVGIIFGLWERLTAGWSLTGR